MKIKHKRKTNTLNPNLFVIPKAMIHTKNVKVLMKNVSTNVVKLIRKFLNFKN